MHRLSTSWSYAVSSKTYSHVAILAQDVHLNFHSVFDSANQNGQGWKTVRPTSIKINVVFAISNQVKCYLNHGKRYANFGPLCEL